MIIQYNIRRYPRVFRFARVFNIARPSNRERRCKRVLRIRNDSRRRPRVYDTCMTGVRRVFGEGSSRFARDSLRTENRRKRVLPGIKKKKKKTESIEIYDRQR